MPDPVEGLTYITKYRTDFLPPSRAWQKVLYISTSWLTVESPGTKPDCRVVITWWSFKKLKTYLCTIFSRTLARVLSKDMGL